MPFLLEQEGFLQGMFSIVNLFEDLWIIAQ